MVNFGGANEFSILMALKSWGLPPESVKIVPAGDSMTRFTALEIAGGIDGTVVPYSNAAIALQRGHNILADLGEIVKEFPDRAFSPSVLSWKESATTPSGFSKASVKRSIACVTNPS